jgi:hypothetical protein
VPAPCLRRVQGHALTSWPITPTTATLTPMGDASTTPIRQAANADDAPIHHANAHGQRRADERARQHVANAHADAQRHAERTSRQRPRSRSRSRRRMVVANTTLEPIGC